MNDFNDTPGQGPEDTSAPCNHFRYAAGDPRITQLGLGAPALDLAALGYHVGPARRGGKPPHGMLGAIGGVHHATSDPAVTRQRWSEDPLANIFVRTGRLPFPGRQVVVADLDVKRGENGPGNFAAFLAENGLALPPGLPVAPTPSGGVHLWLGWPPGWGACPERPALLDGVDIKGDAGYALAPPSHLLTYADGHDGERGGVIPIPYQWESGCPCSVPWAPPWFAEWISTAPAAGRPHSGGTAGPRGDIDAEQIIAHGAEPGKRNNTYYKLACSRYRRHSTSPEGAAVVLDEVRAAWEAGDRTGLPWTEVEPGAGGDQPARGDPVRRAQAADVAGPASAERRHRRARAAAQRDAADHAGL